MKKHLLLTLVLTLGFLWLGSVSLACTSNSECAPLTETCKMPTPPLLWDWICVAITWLPSSDTSCDSCTEITPPNDCSVNQTQKTCNNKNYCCSSLVTWSPCTSDINSKLAWDSNAHVTSIGTCTCNDWYKDVDGTCKSCSDEWVCCGISLNTSVPFIGKCIESEKNYTSPGETWVTWEEAFPVLMWSLTKMLVTVILIVSFVLILIGGIMITTGNPSGGKKMIINVVIGIALLGASWVILRLINPNFFG